MHFIEPRKFASVHDFEAQFGNLDREDKVAELHARLKPHILRRLKKHVEKVRNKLKFYWFAPELTLFVVLLVFASEEWKNFTSSNGGTSTQVLQVGFDA